MSEKKLSATKKRTVSYVKEFNQFTGGYEWVPLWSLSERPPYCCYCQRRGTEYCARIPAPAWFGAECANWLPKDVNLVAVSRIIQSAASALVDEAKDVWCDNYKLPVYYLVRSMWESYFRYAEEPFWTDEKIESVQQADHAAAAEREAARQRFLKRLE